MKKKLITAIACIFALNSTAHANPIVVGTGFAPPELSALIGETLIVALLLSRRKFDFVRILYSWFLITLVTFWVFIAGVAFALTGLFEIVPEPLSKTPIITVTLIEALIIWVEAKIIMGLSRRNFYRKSEIPLPKKSALAVSAVANIGSIIIGAILFSI